MHNDGERAGLTPLLPSLRQLFTTFLVVGVSAVGMGFKLFSQIYVSLCERW